MADQESKSKVPAFIEEHFPSTEEGKILKEAKKRVKSKKDFYVHFMVFIPCILFLAGMAFFLTPHVWWWFLFPTFGWGFGLVAHYLSAFGFPGVGRFDDGWEAYQLEQEYKKIKAKREFEAYLKEGRESEGLELKELEKRYRDEDLV